MKIGRHLTVKADRWPWQVRNSVGVLSNPTTEKAGEKYGWKRTHGMGRFGGGWEYALGFETGGWHDTGMTIILNLLFGMVRITWRTDKGIAADEKWEEEKRRRKAAREQEERVAENFLRTFARKNERRDDEIPF